MTGTFTLSLDGKENEIVIAYDEEPGKLKEKLLALAGLNSEDIEVT